MKALTKAIRDLQILMTEKRGNALVQSNLNYTKMVETGTSVSSQGKGIFFLSVCKRARVALWLYISAYIGLQHMPSALCLLPSLSVSESLY